jgi:chromosome condensin MukBEF MukE localization factor
LSNKSWFVERVDENEMYSIIKQLLNSVDLDNSRYHINLIHAITVYYYFTRAKKPSSTSKFKHSTISKLDYLNNAAISETDFGKLGCGNS